MVAYNRHYILGMVAAEIAQYNGVGNSRKLSGVKRREPRMSGPRRLFLSAPAGVDWQK